MRDTVDRIRQSDPKDRQAHLVKVLEREFAEAAEQDPHAYRLRFRKMAQGPFAFYRGSACLFYDDVSGAKDPFVDERTARIWVHGDLHIENFGTYLNSYGRMVFDVNDFDEAYLGHWTWDLARLAASVALMGYGKAFSDDDITGGVRAFVTAYAEQVHRFVDGDEDDQDFALTVGSTSGAVRDTLVSARLSTRTAQLSGMSAVEDVQRRFVDQPGHTRHVDDDERAAVERAYAEFLETIPEHKRQPKMAYGLKDLVKAWGFGIGSLGLGSYNLLVEGQTETLENDVVLSMKQGAIPALARVVNDGRIQDAFAHQGERTAVSHRALQSHSDPWLGHCVLGGRGYVVSQLSPYKHDLSWEDVAEPEQANEVLRQLGMATAKVHCVSDSHSEQSLVDFSVKQALGEVLDGDGTTALADDLAAFALGYGHQVRDDHRLFVDAFREGGLAGV